MTVSSGLEGGSEMTFSAGDKVQLKAGGPVMTVDNVVGDRVSVAWRDAEGHDQ